jgi:transcriptional regulator with XRE-family HTH domain
MTLTALAYAPAHWIPMPTDALTPQEAGALIRKRRLERGMTQDQLVERTGLSSQSYLSALEKGRYHIGKSDHFPAVARELSLSEEDIRLINPAAVFASPAEVTIAKLMGAEKFIAGASKRISETPPKIELSATLQAFIDKYATTFKELLEPRWQRWLANTDFRDEPETPEDWLAVFMYFREKVNPR